MKLLLLTLVIVLTVTALADDYRVSNDQAYIAWRGEVRALLEARGDDIADNEEFFKPLYLANYAPATAVEIWVKETDTK